MSDYDKEKEPRLIPMAAPRSRKVLVARRGLPEVNRMLSDAYHALAAQMSMFRDAAQREKFDVKDATAFNKLITSLVTLQDTERKNAALLELGKLSPEELEALSGQANALLQGNDDSDKPIR